MGKKVSKKKTKEIKEVVAEALSTGSMVGVGGEASEQQQTDQPRRKRGRPRKINIENTQVEEEKNPTEEKKAAVEEEEGDSKKLKGIRPTTSSSSLGDVKGGTGPSEESKTKEPQQSRRGRRKSQPRKSS